MAAVLVAILDTIHDWLSSPAASRRRGAAGERATARMLRPLEREGYRFLHDRAVSDRANVDHLVIGPAGVFVIDTRHWWNRPMRVSCDLPILIAGRPADQVLRPAAYEAGEIATRLGAELGRDLQVIGLAAIHAPVVPETPVNGIQMLPAKKVAGYIRRQPVKYTSGEVARIAEAAERVLPEIVKAGQGR